MDEDNAEEKRFKKLGFKPQKEIIYNRFLPYADKLEDESLKLFTDIKTNLVRSVMLREMRPGCILWVSRLNKYIKVYGLKFSKEDHIALVKLLYDLITIPDLEPTRINKFATTLTLLLKKKELISPEELQLPWRPLYDLCLKIVHSSQTILGMVRYFSSLDGNLDILVQVAKNYFPVSATQEMLDEWRPLLCPYDQIGVVSAMENFQLYLPVNVRPEQAHITYELWFNEFMTFWEICHNAPLWETNIMWMMAHLASSNVGRIDWEPHIPLMFTRILRSLNLPVSFHGKQSQRPHKMEITPVAMWIVSVLGGNSSAQDHLEKLMHSIESYYHPANAGLWAARLRELYRKLAFYFVQRLHRERYKPPSWETQIPESHRLTENDIDRFVASMCIVTGHVIFSRISSGDIHAGLQYLATLRPNVIVPLVLDKLNGSLGELTEPHKLTSAVQCLVAVARPMVRGPHFGYPEGPTHVIPLLHALLPGIDPNDIRKCLVTFQFISTFVSMVPLIDSSNAGVSNNLTEEEDVVCEASASLEDFVLQFFDKVFTLVHSSSLEITRLEQTDLDKRSKLEAVAESALASICNVVVTQTSDDIFNEALRKLHGFVDQNILETRVSGQMVAIIVKSFVRIKPDETLKVFVPDLSNRLLNLYGEHDNIEKEEHLDSEILYVLLILSEMLDCSGTSLLPYLDVLIEILDKSLHLACMQAYIMATHLLNHILVSLTYVAPLEYRSAPPPFYSGGGVPCRDWGAPGDAGKLRVLWYEPGPREMEAATRLVHRYLPPEMTDLEEYVNGQKELTREEMRRKLGIILGCLGAQSVLPLWEEVPYLNIPSRLQPWAFEMIIGTELTIDMPDGSNIRKSLADLMGRLQSKLLTCKEDDTKSFFNLIGIWDALIMTKYRGRDFESHWKNFHLVKKVLADFLRGGKNHLRPLLIDRVMLHQEFRTESRSFTFTETHRQILLNLYRLGTSHYSEVRLRAQKKLFQAVSCFPYAYTVLTPAIKESLSRDTRLHHEEFKGCLYVLLGPKSTPIIARHDWTFVYQLWPTLVNSKPSEKPSVINLMNNVVEAIHKHFPTISIKFKIPQNCLETVALLKNNVPKPHDLSITEQDIEIGINELKRLSLLNEKIYQDILLELYKSLASGKLHWRYHMMALSFVRDLIHPNALYPTEIVKYILHCLIHDSIEVRKLAIRIMIFILKQHKRKHPKITIDPRCFKGTRKLDFEVVDIDRPGLRADNLWVLYDSSNSPITDIEWDKPRYVYKQFNGFYTWPKTIQVYAASDQQPPVDRKLEDMIPQEQEIDKFFCDEGNVEKLIKFLSLEEKKGRDKFNIYRFLMFKNLFRNYGERFIPSLFPHLSRLIESGEEGQQRCASEIMAGAMRGCKHWGLAGAERLWGALCPLARQALHLVTQDTINDWGVMLATATENRDPNKLYQLLEMMMEEPLTDRRASFIECARMYIFHGALMTQLWRVGELKHRLLVSLEPHLGHQFHNVRDRVASMLVTVLEADVAASWGTDPRLDAQAFVSRLVPQLRPLLDTNHTLPLDTLMQDVQLDSKQTNTDKEHATRLFKTLCRWIIGTINRSTHGLHPAFYQLFDVLVSVQGAHEADEELTTMSVGALGHLAHSLTLARHSDLALSAVLRSSRSRSWSARAACADFLQAFVFHNMHILATQPTCIAQVRQIVLALLEDENPDVRVQAGTVLSGLLHCRFLPNTESLLARFIKTARRRECDMRVTHGAVLGLCAFVSAWPYAVPAHVPTVLGELGAQLARPMPIPATIRHTMGHFKRTHHDDWQKHQLAFTPAQLDVLQDLNVPPTYYA